MALSSYQRKAIRQYRSFLSAANLSEDEVLARTEDDPEAIAPVFKSMTDQIVRSVVISAYTFVDEQLNHEIHKHFFGVGQRLKRARRSKRFRTMQLMLQQVFLLQKLSLVQKIREVPRSISSHIHALNDLRNGIAHAFLLDQLPTAKRTFKAHDVFTIEGLEAFKDAMNQVDHFFMPYLAEIYGEVEPAQG